ncbi:DUF1684 domain-containing protein [Brachybacterium sp. UNK5269]|uniref:DUF1684 domain-containing protein n=1 Tax=Brachybacterium sp. UNK5269 TaxID=3408576 RepID=UPI003BB0A82D
MSDEAAWREFRRRRDASLAASHGVLSQVDLIWIDPAAGAQRAGAVPGRWEIRDGHLVGTWEDEDLRVLAGAPEIVLHQQAGRSRVTVLADTDVRLVTFGQDLQCDVIRRGDRIGLRVLDPAAPRRTAFAGVPTYPFDPSAVLTGTWRPAPATVTVGSALPWLTQHLPSPGVATLDVDGAPVEMVLTGTSTLSFTDETSGTTSAEWRAVTAQLDGDRITVDLNRALNFPSAFSAWGTCPRPPAGNHLPLPVTAGERVVEQTRR